MCMVLFYPTIKVTILPLNSCREILEKRQIEDHRRQEKEKNLGEQNRVCQERGTPNYLRIVNLMAPVVPKTRGAFNFNPQYPTAGVLYSRQESRNKGKERCENFIENKKVNGLLRQIDRRRQQSRRRKK